MSEYTEQEKRVLLAGMLSGRERDAVWSAFPEAIESLGDRGLLRLGHEMMANGAVASFPLSLSLRGIGEARRLQEVDQVAWNL